MKWITENWAIILQVMTGTITVASIIVKATPTKEDDKWLAKIISLLSVIAINPKQNKGVQKK
ncbi:MAG TPA: hypothetical protein VMX17_08365 [Candidatus Glassbacteria bacterium]|nr:hypothetical protein [Candidatus Glassbacteria bacterium]